ncbi:MAG TPA: ribonuclease HII [Puia sp.]|nr:ribonuclease HII [Puia sp.]
MAACIYFCTTAVSKGSKMYFWGKHFALLKTGHQSILLEAGCDEAGRGCYAGPVFAAAVILPKDFFHPLLNDSKQVKEQDRYLLRIYIEQAAIDSSVASVDHEEIDRINILNASFKAMHLAIEKLRIPPGFLLIDGNRFSKYKQLPHECIVQGDSIYASIAAASILAKTYRDDYMKELHDEFPIYKWNTNKGYGTREHCEAIEVYGLSRYHRKSFNIVPGC